MSGPTQKFQHRFVLSTSNGYHYTNQAYNDPHRVTDANDSSDNQSQLGDIFPDHFPARASPTIR